MAEKRYTDPMIAAHVLLAQSLFGAAGASGAAQVNPILAGGGGIEDIINPVRAKLRAIAKQPKYNGNPRRWTVFKREFSLWVGKNKLRDDEKLDALLQCLEGPIRDTWIRSYTDRADSSNPPTYSELFALLEGRGSRLPEDHYRTLHLFPETFPSSFFTRFRISGNALKIWWMRLRVPGNICLMAN